MGDGSEDSSLAAKPPGSKNQEDFIPPRTIGPSSSIPSSLLVNTPNANETSHVIIPPSHLMKHSENLRHTSRFTPSNQARSIHSGAMMPALSHAQPGPWTPLHLGDQQFFSFTQMHHTMEQPHRRTNDHQTDHLRRLPTTIPAPAPSNPSHQRPSHKPKVSFPSHNRRTVIHHHHQPLPIPSTFPATASFPSKRHPSSMEASTPNLTADVREITRKYSEGNISYQQFETMLCTSLHSSLAKLNLRKSDNGGDASITAAGTAGQAGRRITELERYQCTECFKSKKTKSQLK